MKTISIAVATLFLGTAAAMAQPVTGSFTSGGAYFPNSYSTAYDSWDGWAYSNVGSGAWVTNSNAPGIDGTDYYDPNQYAAAPGAGPSGPGSAYAICYLGYYNDPSATMGIISLPSPTTVTSAQISNNIYAALAMQYGDGGGGFGVNPFTSADSFTLVISASNAIGQATGMPVSLPLVTSGTNIVTSWQSVDLTGLGSQVKTLQFNLQSSQLSSMPTYFALGSLTTAEASINFSNLSLPTADTYWNGAPLIWGGSNSATWDVGVTPNFSSGAVSYLNSGFNAVSQSGAFTYSDGSNVIFDDTAATASVNISGAVSPNSVTFYNANAAYTISGGTIAGSGSLTVAGGGLVTLTNTNTYTGGTFVSSGTLVLDGASSLAVGSALILGTAPDASAVSNPAASVNAAVAPEPGTAGLLLVAALALIVAMVGRRSLRLAGPTLQS